MRELLRGLRIMVVFFLCYFALGLIITFSNWVIDTYADTIAVVFFTALFGSMFYAIYRLSKGNK